MDDTKTSEKQAFVYVISHHDENGAPCAPIKIGVTTDCTRRLHELKIGNPQTIGFFAKFSFLTEERAYLVERKLHSYFDDGRLEGEWFDVNPQDVISQYMLYSSLEIETLREEIIATSEFAWDRINVIARHSSIIHKFIATHKNGWDLCRKFETEVNKDKSLSGKPPRWWLKIGYDEAGEIYRSSRKP